MRQRRHPPKTPRGSLIRKRFLRALHAPAWPPAQNHERFVDYEKNSEDAPRASAAAAENHETVVDSKENSADAPRVGVATCRKPREGRRFRS